MKSVKKDKFLPQERINETTIEIIIHLMFIFLTNNKPRKKTNNTVAPI